MSAADVVNVTEGIGEPPSARVRSGGGGGLGRYILIRFLLIIPTVFILVTLVFVLMRSTGDPITAKLGGQLPADQLAERIHAAGYDRPIFVQYLEYLGQIATGNFGTTLTEALKDVLRNAGNVGDINLPGDETGGQQGGSGDGGGPTGPTDPEVLQLLELWPAAGHVVHAGHAVQLPVPARAPVLRAPRSSRRRRQLNEPHGRPEPAPRHHPGHGPRRFPE